MEQNVRVLWWMVRTRYQNSVNVCACIWPLWAKPPGLPGDPSHPPLAGKSEKHCGCGQHLEPCTGHLSHTAYWFHDPEGKQDFEVNTILLDSWIWEAPYPQVINSDFQKQKTKFDFFFFLDSRSSGPQPLSPPIIWLSWTGGESQAGLSSSLQLEDRSTVLRKGQMFLTQGFFPE